MNFEPKEEIDEEININDKVYSVDSKINEEEIKNAYQKLYGTLDSYDPNAINESKMIIKKSFIKTITFILKKKKKKR